ncbi:MAG: YegS/Rv2252/BmrU family lipid kinase [Chitinophagia bacterium]|jgi:YegS/Rv2252/BmrU family lipid kinase
MKPVTLLFVINPISGTARRPWQQVISNYYNEKQVQLVFFILSRETTAAQIKAVIHEKLPDRVIAVGGDGTIKMVASALLNLSIPLGIIPAGSANGLAYELGIPGDPMEALEMIETGTIIQIHAIAINNEICLHLADIGLNARAIKKFNRGKIRGWLGYGWASLHALYTAQMHRVTIQMESETLKLRAAMIVLANGKSYSTGAVINPPGSLTDQHFELVVMKEISFLETLKMLFTHQPFDSEKVEIFPLQSATIRCNRRIPFQVDGEYIGKVKNIQARIIKEAIAVIVPHQ